MRKNKYIKTKVLHFLALCSVSLSLPLLLAGCSQTTSISSETFLNQVTNESASIDGSEATQIICDGNSVSVQGSGASVQGTTVTITAGGTFQFSGNLDHGQIVIEASDQDSIGIMLSDFHLTQTEAAAIYGKQYKDLTFILADGTNNSVTAGTSLASPVSDGPDAAVFSKLDFTINGKGDLHITATQLKGIKSKQSLTIENGDFTIVADDDAFHSKEDMVINGGSFTVTTGDDAFHADKNLIVNEGDIAILSCYEGLESATVTINGGNIHLTSTDDGINAASDESDDLWIRITEGTISIDASGDGVDSNGDFFMEGGTLFIDGPEDGGNSPIDYDKTATVTGGTIIAVGNSRMLQSFDSQSSQPVIVSYYESEQKAGTDIIVSDLDNTIIIEYTPAKAFSAAIISTPDIINEQTYTLTTGDNVENITITQVINQVGTQAANGQMPGFGGKNSQSEKQPPSGEQLPSGEQPPSDMQPPSGERPGREGNLEGRPDREPREGAPSSENISNEIG